MSEIDRDNNGRFKKGTKSPNPGGRGNSKGIVSYIMSKTNNLQDLVDLAYTILNQHDTKNKDKITIITMLMNRAIGTPQASVHNTGDLSITVGLPEDIDDV